MTKRGNWTDRSGSITTGGEAQVLSAAAPNRDGFIFQNLHSSADMWIDFGATAVADQPSIRIIAGASLFLDVAVPVAAASVFCGTTGAKFACKDLF